jgi:hypothetical protein
VLQAGLTPIQIAEDKHYSVIVSLLKTGVPVEPAGEIKTYYFTHSLTPFLNEQNLLQKHSKLYGFSILATNNVDRK